MARLSFTMSHACGPVGACTAQQYALTLGSPTRFHGDLTWQPLEDGENVVYPLTSTSSVKFPES